MSTEGRSKSLPALKDGASRVIGGMATGIATGPTRGPSPKAPSEPRSKRALIADERRVVIASCHKPTRAAMHAYADVLVNRGAARCALLRTTGRRELDHLGAGTFR